jgi:hypothetical protein
MAETVAEIKRQGGLVYVPHPFDRMHAVPDYEHLPTILDDIDAIEVFNPRVAIGAFNEEAVRFAAKYRLVAGAGSDSHVAQGLGSVRIRMRDFDGPREFLQSLRDAEIRVLAHDSDYSRVVPRFKAEAPPVLDHRGTRRAPRFKMAAGVTVKVGGKSAQLIDLSTVGAQVVSPATLKPNQEVAMALPDAGGAIQFDAKVAWTSFVTTPEGAPRYRAGIDFINADAAAVDVFLQRRKA